MGGMEWYMAGALLLGTVVFLMALSVPVPFAFLLADVVGLVFLIGGDVGLKQLVANMTSSITHFTLVAVPLFILMGELFFHTGIASRVFDVFDKLLGNVRGRLSYLVISGGALFGALSGSSMANTAMLGSSLLPEMQRRGYKPHVSMGPIIATGGLAILIPPSALAVLLGSLARIDIGDLLIAGVVPGVMLAALFALVVFVSVRLDPDAAPQYVTARALWGEKIRLIVTDLLPMGIVVFMVIGLIVLGITTPTESAAFGVLGVLIVAVLFRALTWQAVAKSLTGAARVSGMVFLVILGSTSFSELLALSGASYGVISWATSLQVSPYTILAIMFLTLLFLGMLMESVSIMMLTVPIFFPLALSLGFDPVWFGILNLIALEIGLATPPFGLCLFVMLGVAPAGATLPQVSLAVLPYLLCTVLMVLLLVLFPGLTSIF
ncbi:TRAP transporter large permease [Actibacterium sp. D379-3]